MGEVGYCPCLQFGGKAVFERGGFALTPLIRGSRHSVKSSFVEQLIPRQHPHASFLSFTALVGAALPVDARERL